MNEKTTHYYNNESQIYKSLHTCAGLNCSNKPISTLKVKYINKTGHFCQRCTDDLLTQNLLKKFQLVNYRMTDSSSKLWSDDCIIDALFNLLKTNSEYTNQAKEKFEYFRIKSPVPRYEIKINDLPDEIKSQLEYLYKKL